jgi:hypothetical protein
MADDDENVKRRPPQLDSAATRFRSDAPKCAPEPPVRKRGTTA